MSLNSKYQAIVIGTSAGGLAALMGILRQLPADYSLPIMIVQHRFRDQKNLLEEVLQNKCEIEIRQVDEKERIESGIIYIAPPDYHLLIESDRTFSLSSDPFVSFSRPSIDVLFESAASVYGRSLVGILLTGANKDGAAGLNAIRKAGGLTIAQSPADAEYPYMPQAAIDAGAARLVLKLSEIQTEMLEQFSLR